MCSGQKDHRKKLVCFVNQSAVKCGQSSKNFDLIWKKIDHQQSVILKKIEHQILIDDHSENLIIKLFLKSNFRA